MPFILISGGTGYIGSHTVVALISAGYNPVIVDNLSNSKIYVLERIEAITGKRPPNRPASRVLNLPGLQTNRNRGGPFASDPGRGIHSLW
mgnify:CR=1 FL=1